LSEHTRFEALVLPRLDAGYNLARWLRTPRILRLVQAYPTVIQLRIEVRMTQKWLALLLVAGGLFGVGVPSWADNEYENPVQLSKALTGVSVSLEQGLRASERKGKPISGKFEIEKGVLQLSIYTLRGTQLSEVIIDLTSGNILKVEHIAEADDLRDANAQSQAMAKAKVSLEKAVRDALAAYKTYRAVSVAPKIGSGGATADITLMKGEDVKKFSEKLD
jgi:hypothetical protein